MGYDNDNDPQAQQGRQLYPPPSAPPGSAFGVTPPMHRQPRAPACATHADRASQQPPMDAVVPWHERQRVWRTLGLVVGSVGGAAAVTGVQPLLVSLAGSAVPAFAVGLAGVSPLAPLAWTLGGAAAVVLGVKMWSRRCYRDPEAVRAYYIDFCQRGFLAAVADHDFEDLLRIASPEGMAAKLFEEMAALPPGFDAVWRVYGEANLTQIVRARVLTQDYLCAKLALDHPDPELDLPVVGDGPAIDLIRAMRAYGRWLVTHLDVSPAWIRHQFARDERVRNLAFSQFVAEGGMELHPNAAAKLIDREQLRGMFWRELQQCDWSFRRVKELCEPWLFARDPLGLADDMTDDQEDDEGVYTERSLIRPEELAELFHKEIVGQDLCDLLDLYWHWPLSEHGRRLVPDSELLGKLRVFQTRYEKVVKADADERRQVKDRYKRERQAATDIYDTKASAAQRAFGKVETKYGKRTIKPRRNAPDQKSKSSTHSEPMEVDGEDVVVSSSPEPEVDPVEAKKAERKLAKARSKRDGALEAARLELTLLTTVLESDRDDRLRAVDGRLRADKERLNAEWVDQREHHLHSAYPVLHFPEAAAPLFPPLAGVPFPGAFAPSAPPIETQHLQVNYFLN